MIVGQVPGELEQVVALYKERQPKSVLEIGVFYGGTLKEWLENAQPATTIVAVDPAHLNPHLYDTWKKNDTLLIVVEGRTGTQETDDQVRLNGPYEWIFIDGDHTQEAIDHDIELARSVLVPDGVILIHDIAAEGYPPIPPRIAFDRVKVEGFSWEIVEEPPDWYASDNGHGIGVVQF